MNGLDQIWQKALESIKEKLAGPSFETWFMDVTLIELTKDEAIIETHNSFNRDWLETHYTDVVQDALLILLVKDQMSLLLLKEMK